MKYPQPPRVPGRLPENHPGREPSSERVGAIIGRRPEIIQALEIRGLEHGPVFLDLLSVAAAGGFWLPQAAAAYSSLVYEVFRNRAKFLHSDGGAPTRHVSSFIPHCRQDDLNPIGQPDDITSREKTAAGSGRRVLLTPSTSFPVWFGINMR